MGKRRKQWISRSIQGHDIFKLCWPRVQDATYQVFIGTSQLAKYKVSLKSVIWFRRTTFKVFAINSSCGHIGHVTLTAYTNFGSLFVRVLYMKFDFDPEEMFEHCGQRQQRK